MSINSVNTNASALVALESLNATNSALTQAQNEVSTGLRVAGATDNGAIWSVAQTERGDVAAFGVVQSSLNRGISTVDVAVNAGQTISDLLNQMKAVALSGSDSTATTAEVSAYSTQFAALASQISKIVSTADFDGANLLKSGGTSVNALASADGTVKVTVAAEKLTLGGIGLSGHTTFATTASATSVLALVNTAIGTVNTAVAKLGVGATALQTELSFVQTQTDALTTGIGNLVDADVAAESATLTALQTKQQLGSQALAIANQAPSHLLSLFQG